MQCQALVDEGVIGRQQVQHAAILAKDAADKQFHFTTECRPQGVVEIREDDRIRVDLLERTHLQPLEREVADERFSARVGEQPPHLCVEHTRCRESTALGDGQQFLVRGAPNQEEGQARGQFDVANRVDAAGRQARRRALRAVEELRARQNRRQRVPDRRIEITESAGGAVKRDRRLEIRLGDRATVRLARK